MISCVFAMRPKACKTRSSYGFTLIELMIFVSIMGLILVAVAGFAATTSRQMRINYHKLYATRYSEEALEWLRILKEQDWNAFYAAASVCGSSPCTRCLNTNLTPNSTLSSLTNGSECPFNGMSGQTSVPPIYRRQIIFTYTNAQQPVGVRSVVSWNEAGGAMFSVPLSTVFSPL
jgi:type II secretory pathway pseudopilin PulG